MYLDTMQEIFSSAGKVLVDTKANNTLYLPLDKMMDKSAAHDAAIGSKSGVAPVPQPQAQPQPQQQAAQPEPAPAPAQVPESVRQRDARSRESQRDRETR
jgi:membrane protease subunit HflK